MLLSKIKVVKRKALDIKPSGRSTDFITPSFGFGCLYQCSYCYCKRHVTEGLSIAENVDEILEVIDVHAYNTIHDGWFKNNKPNQTDSHYITYDIGCNEDLALHAKHHDLDKIFHFFQRSFYAKASFATKYVNPNLPNIPAVYAGKIRIRFSLMPGYEVHLNFSPVIVHDNWLQSYMSLFNTIDGIAKSNGWADDRVKAEVIFLTHNEAKHWYNVEHKIPGEEFLWTPKIQEAKTSQYGGKNVRYEHKRKAQYIDQFRQIHTGILPWNTIRYIF